MSGCLSCFSKTKPNVRFEECDEEHDRKQMRNGVCKPQKIEIDEIGNHKAEKVKFETPEQLDDSTGKVIEESKIVRKYASRIDTVARKPVDAVVPYVETDNPLKRMMSRKLREQKRSHLQDKIESLKSLEQTILKQQTIIDKMEHLLQIYLRRTDKKNPKQETESSPEDIVQEKMFILQEQVATLKMREEQLRKENDMLKARVQESENRAIALESKASTNSTNWEREKQALTSRMSQIITQTENVDHNLADRRLSDARL